MMDEFINKMDEDTANSKFCDLKEKWCRFKKKWLNGLKCYER